MPRAPTAFRADPRQISIFDVLGDPGPCMRPDRDRIPVPCPATPPDGAAPFTAEEVAAIEGFVTGQAFGPESFVARMRWRDWLARGAVPTVLPGPLLRRKEHAQVLLTETRLGYTAGWDYEQRDYGAGEGGHLDPCWDTEGAYLWLTRQAAIHAGGHELYVAVQGRCPLSAAEVRKYCLQHGIDVASPPDRALQRRLVTRERIRLRAAVPAPDDVDADMEPNPEALAYERAIGLSDVPEQAMVRVGPTVSPEPEPGAEFAHEPTPTAGEDDPHELLREMVADSTPKGIPSCVDGVVTAYWLDGVLVGRLRMWDGAYCCLRATPAPGGYRTFWDHHGREPPYWEGARRAWRRGAPEAIDEDDVEVDAEDEAPAPVPVSQPEPAPTRPVPIPVTGSGVSAEDAAYVHAAVLELMLKGRPSYVSEILRVRRTPARTVCGFVKLRPITVATVRLFDGHLAQVKLFEDVGEPAYAGGLRLRTDRADFTFDEEAWAWKRVEEPPPAKPARTRKRKPVTA
ncbi:hypothetical protein [Methylobacterium sp. WL6]|uniref:hypothetical protein n=1 Tax=Methylobacterium sp. WL6 TaxID=2603901 RepID=UPI0011CAA755|nr:hypothetical protein [Methylobacterium sp. WL6]TXN73262.1 hypothetical protein FV230_01970 [Methylobacterium sp. WL6]